MTDTPRLVTRNGTIYQQNTANIGKRRERVDQETARRYGAVCVVRTDDNRRYPQKAGE